MRAVCWGPPSQRCSEPAVPVPAADIVAWCGAVGQGRGMLHIWHWWFSGRILACHAGGPGSIPGQCNSSSFLHPSVSGGNFGDTPVTCPCRRTWKRWWPTW